jgi:ribonuclease T
MSTNQEVFISVDIETAGPIPGEYSLLSIGACRVDEDTQAFECQLRPVNGNFDPKALEVTGLSLEALKHDGLAPAAAMEQFQHWIRNVSGVRGQPVFVGFNAPFDWSFVNYYFHKYLGANPFGFSALDIKALYMGATGCSWHDSRSSKIAARLKPKLHGTHDALHDARYQAELFRLIRKPL